MTSTPRKFESPLLQILKSIRDSRAYYITLAAIVGIIYFAASYVNDQFGDSIFSLLAESIEIERENAPSSTSWRLPDYLLTIFAILIILTIMLAFFHFALTRKVAHAENEADVLRKNLEEVNSFTIVEAREPPAIDYKDIQERFVEKIYNTPEAKHKKVTVLGFSYAWFWPETIINRILTVDSRNSDLCRASGWSFVLYYTSFRYLQLGKILDLFGQYWIEHSRLRETDMKDWVADQRNQDFLRKHGIKLKIILIHCCPVKKRTIPIGWLFAK